MKHFFTPNHALSFHLAWLPLHFGWGGVGVDYLFHPASLASTPDFDLVVYAGVGVGVAFSASQAGLIVKPPLGIGFHFHKAPIDTVVEGTWSPLWIAGPPTFISLGHGDVSLKIRYYF